MLAFAVACACVSAFLFPVPMIAAWQVVIVYLTEGQTAVFPANWCLSAVAAVLVSGVLRVLSSYWAHRAAFILTRELRLAVLEHLGRLPLHWFSGKSTGSIKKVISVDIGEVESFVSHNVTDFFHTLLVPVLCIAILAWISMPLAFIILTMLIGAVFFHASSMRKMSSSNLLERYGAALNMLHADTLEFVHGMPVVKIYNRSVDSFDRMQRAIATLKDMQSEVLGFHFIAWARFLGIIAVPFSLVAVVGGFLCREGLLVLNHYILALFLSGVALLPLQRLVRFVALLQFARNGWNSMQTILDTPVEMRGMRLANEVREPKLAVTDLTVELEGVPVLKNVSFTAEPGTVTAIVGPSGSGKSTLAAALAGMEAAQSGVIRIGGFPLQEFSSAEAAKLFSVVFQRPFLFTGTIRDNILFGKEDASQETVEAAVRAACCENLIASLPHGYDTVIGSGGEVHLSGGQRQRISLARMALRNAPIVLLDEVTSFADPESEAAIQEALSRLLAGKSIIVIAHRLASIAEADNIIVLDGGCIVEQGRHADLMILGGVYSRLWEANKITRSWSLPVRKHEFP
jgi:ATP-binding cassette subfamily B protein